MFLASEFIVFYVMHQHELLCGIQKGTLVIMAATDVYSLENGLAK